MALPIIIILIFQLLHNSSVSAHLNDPWGAAFRPLAGCSSGDNRTGISSVKKYLRRFGYIPSGAPTTNFSDEFDGTLRDAIQAYQRHFNLNVTGALDSSTVDLMVKPRCGVADVDVNGTSTMSVHGRNLYTYFPGNPMWGTTTLTYAFVSTSDAVEQTVLRSVFTRAFARWSEVSTLTFTEISTTSSFLADITVGFFSGDHGDGEPFDGPLGTLAHAFSPTNGRLHLDADERWVAVTADAASPELYTSDNSIDLESVAVHEIGHLLGLGHSTVEDSIMYPLLGVATRKVELKEDDVLGIQSLYGSNPNYDGDASSFSTDSPPTTTTTVSESEDNGSGGTIPVAGGARMGLLIGAVATVVASAILFV